MTSQDPRIIAFDNRNTLLDTATKLNSPDKKSPGSLLASFSRSMFINIDWDSILGDYELNLGVDIREIKKAFEESWGGLPLKSSKQHGTFIGRAPDSVKRYFINETVKPGSIILYLVGPKRKKPVNSIEYKKRGSFERIKKEIYLGPFPRNITRFFELKVEGDTNAINFWNQESYEDAWGKVREIEEIFPRKIVTSEVKIIGGVKSRIMLQNGKWDDAESQENFVEFINAADVTDKKIVFERFCDEYASNNLDARTPYKKYVLGGELYRISSLEGTLELENGSLLAMTGNSSVIFLIVLKQHAIGSEDRLIEDLIGLNGSIAYEYVWENDIESFIRVYKKGDVELEETSSYYLDLTSRYILTEFKRLDSRQGHLKKIAAAADALDATSFADKSQIEVDDLIQKFDYLQQPFIQNQLALQKLQSLAASKGLILPLTDDEIEVDVPKKDGGPEKIKLKKGELYRKFINTTSWLEETNSPPPPYIIHPPIFLHGFQPDLRFDPIGDLGKAAGNLAGGVTSIITGIPSAIPIVSGIANDVFNSGTKHKSKKKKTYLTRVVKNYTDYKLLKVSSVALEQATTELAEDGFQVFVFSLTRSGYVDDKGQNLSELMNYCKFNPEFRKSVALLIPEYLEDIFNGVEVVGYHIIKCPKPGGEIIEPPKLWIEDKLSFSMKLDCSEIGSILGSINLAPGESRTLSISRSFEYSSESISDRTLESERSENFTSDFQTEFKNVARLEKEKSKEGNWSANASGNYLGIVQGGASGGEKKSETTKSFAEKISTIAVKAASNITTKSNLKISSKSSTSIRIDNQDTINSTIVNINQGRTLNFLFYEILNVFKMSVNLEDIEIGASSGVELVSGTGIIDRIVVGVSDVEKAILHLISGGNFYDRLKIDPYMIALAAFDELRKTFYKNYFNESDSQKNQSLFTATNSDSDRSDDIKYLSNIGKSWIFNGKQTLKSDGIEMLIGILNDDDAEDKIKETIESGNLEKIDLPQALKNDLQIFISTLENTIKTKRLMKEEVLRLPSGAVYMESLIGENSATEPYSDAMRSAEFEAKMAQTKLVTAEARLKESLAKFNEAKLNRFKPLYLLKKPTIKEIQALEIDLSDPLPEGVWIFMCNTGAFAIPNDFIGKTKITLDQANRIGEGSDDNSSQIVEIGSGVFIGENSNG